MKVGSEDHEGKLVFREGVEGLRGNDLRADFGNPESVATVMEGEIGGSSARRV
jgi:hypothetical protein